ncbi:ead/Ea22-like family protein [Enterobacter cloacae]|nr:ead/Ea22-like family protein [Enterobacter cloacae]EKX9062410.1 ead/Ea22-like family protein [Enterobacter cloacae]
MNNIDKQALRKAAMHAKTMDDWGCDADNFHDKATPDVVLALLDELEAKDSRIEKEIGRANREHHRGFMMACGHLKEHSNVHYADAAEMEIAALRKRINELENAAAGKGE